MYNVPELLDIFYSIFLTCYLLLNWLKNVLSRKNNKHVKISSSEAKNKILHLALVFIDVYRNVCLKEPN